MKIILICDLKTMLLVSYGACWDPIARACDFKQIDVRFFKQWTIIPLYTKVNIYIKWFEIKVLPKSHSAAWSMPAISWQYILHMEPWMNTWVESDSQTLSMNNAMTQTMYNEKSNL